ncbi:MAG TPA: serine hydrolase [Saprospiraceae bacterium]|nr:serine hydrolase [Saprospiraceae bacterium]
MKYFKTILFLAFFALWTIPAFTQIGPAQIKTLDSTLTVLNEQAMFNGTVLVADHGKVLYKKAFGKADIATREPLKTTSSFNLASVSKQFIAMMVMMLEEKGKLHYDDPVKQYLPAFPYETITIRHLLTHTSGLPEYFDLVLAHRNTLDTLTNTKLVQLLAEFKPKPNFAPGERWEYCNTGYVLLASVIEKAANMPVESFFKQQITDPLGLRNTYIYTLEMKQSPPGRVFGFRRENGREVSSDLMRFDGVVGDGNIYSSVDDLLKWDQALYTEKLVSAKSMKLAFTPVKLNNSQTHNYGFGWFVDSTGQVVSHTGSWVGFLNEIVRDTKKQQTVIVLSSGSDAAARACVKAILAGKKPNIPHLELITNIQLIDGTGSPARVCSVRLRDNKIWETGDLTPLPGESVTDGGGKVLAPGFIDSHSHHFGGLMDSPGGLALVSQGVTSIVIGQDGNSYPIDTLERMMKETPVAINVATYTGHTTVRETVMGENDVLRIARPEEVVQMQALMKAEMDKGSLGLATGLEYERAFYSNRSEVVELAKTTAASGGRYISHIRSEDVGLDEAVDEIIQIGREAKLPVQISHIKIAKRDRWGYAPTLLAQLENARAAGIDITADCYPYDFWRSTLRVLFPNRDYTSPASAEFAVNQLFDPEKSPLLHYAPHPEYSDKTVLEVAALRKETPAQTLMYLIAAAAEFDVKNPNYKGNTEGIMGKSMAESDLESFLAWPHTNICSDGSWGGHPRGYGAFTRVLGRYVRERKIMSLESAVFKMTGLAAEHLGIGDRGVIAPGYSADLVLFDPATVQDNATVQNPDAISTGIEKVWVNGKLVFENRKTTGELPGVFIKRK